MTPELEQLKRMTPQEEFEAGVAIYRRGAVRPLEERRDDLRYVVDGDPRRTVRVGIGDRLAGKCSCAAFEGTHKPCRHVVAAILLAHGSGLVEEARRRRARSAADELLSALEPALPVDSPVQIEWTLQLLPEPQQGARLRLAMRMGQERLYVVRNIAQMLKAVREKTPLAFGKGFTLQPAWMTFERADELMLRVLDEVEYIQRMAGTAPVRPDETKYMTLPDVHAARLLRILLARPFRLAVGDRLLSLPCVVQGPVQLHLLLQGSGRELQLTADLPARLRALTADCEFVLCDGEALRVPQAQRRVLQVLLDNARQDRAAFRFEAGAEERVISELLPRLSRAGEVELDGALAERIVRRPLQARVYLDREGRAVTARTIFAYGEEEIDPFAAQTEGAQGQETAQSGSRLLLMRDAAGEHRVLECLAGAGFRVRAGRVYLAATEAVYAFLTEGVNTLREGAQVFCSEDFKRMTPRKPHFAGTLHMQGGVLQLSLQESGQPAEELLLILQALRDRKKYFHLKDGTFLDLSGMEDWFELADTVADSTLADMPDSTEGYRSNAVDMAAYRAAYLTSLLDGSSLPVQVDDSVRAVTARMGEAGDPCPEPLRAVLRPYQQRGFAWMQALHRLHMGGILADDMGLGKTLQVIALLLWACRKEPGSPSIVVAPTSLVYNWQAELLRFAPELRVLVAEGGQAARQAQIDRLKAGEADVFVTSYPLIRRDIALLSDVRFRFAVLDEAQHIKNAMSVSAAAVKQLTARTRLALTGTPMENHPGELWSIFDFVLPGYLMSYAQFMHRHGEGQNSESLRQRIRPFLLRRLKGDVLRELPEKMETQLYADMTEEQRNVYQASLLRLRGHVDNLLRTKGMQRGRVEVLAAITELRQICCHPALCLPDYCASSGKIDMLLDILPGALEAGHRALVFSQFTRMLRILQRRLEAAGITCLYLDGETPPKKRMGLVNRFNGGEGQVFLISLKAGGAGLNLTGADTVIHYDPWWNPAAEDQATDRVHRIGQKNKVQVIRLITHASIEEQVVRLGERKRRIFDAMVTAGEQMPTQLSEADIRALFDEAT